MNQDNMFSNDYVYSLQQQSEANYERALRAEEALDAIKKELETTLLASSALTDRDPK